MGDWGIKVTKTGKGVTSTDLRDLLMHSNYSMFKYHLDTTTTMTINAADTSKTVTVPHNLGYVPAFLVYSNDSTYTTLLPQRRSYYTGEDEHIFATADSTNIYITWKSTTPLYRQTYYASDSWSSAIERYYTSIGDYGDPFGGLSCAILFSGLSITKTETITSATLDFSVVSKGSNNNVKMKTYGIDEDNTSSFGGYPLGRTTTSAYKEQEQSSASTPFSFGINVIDMFNEVRTRGGWASGNNMGFLMFNNGTTTGAYFLGGYSDCKLTIQRSGTLSYSFRVLVFKDKIA
jgi:hypothetical protein